MITAGENKASKVIMDCRDEPGKDNGKKACVAAADRRARARARLERG
jgi:hypothetical protein